MNDFQQAMAQALLAPEGEEAGTLQHLTAQPGFAVYRNTVLKGCVDALEANFPTVARLVGSDWFRSAALAYVRANPPTDSRLLAYGDAGFADFVQAVPTAADLPYLAGVAHLDTLWRACHGAADALVLPPDALAGLAPEALAQCTLAPHPATRWAWFPAQPVAGIWSRQRSAAPNEEGDLVWAGDGLLLTRIDEGVDWQPLPRAGCHLLDVCALGLPLGEAAQHALSLEPEADLGAVLRQLLQAAAFTPAPTTRCLS